MRFPSSPVLAGIVGGCFQLLLLVARTGGYPASHAHVGTQWLEQGNSSPAIEELSRFAYEPIGYDGQMFLFIGTDPANAPDYLDAPAYRFARVLYPVVARVFAPDVDWLPTTLLLLNVAAVVVATYAAATFLVRHGASAWWALGLACYPGLWIGVDYDLSEPMAYALVAVALAIFDRHVWASAALFAAAALTRETTLLFAAAAAVILARGGWRRAAMFGAAALLPLLAWKAWLYAWLGSWGRSDATHFEVVPFGGVQEFDVMIACVAAPALLAVALATRRLSVAALALALNVAALVIFLPAASWGGYIATGRMSIGVVLAFLFCVPHVQPRWLALGPFALWQLGWLPPH